MEDIEKLRGSNAFGNRWVVQQTADFVNECIRRRTPANTATEQWLTECAELRLQRAVGAARFRAVLTTNFDTCIEDSAPGAFEPLLRADLNSEHRSCDALGGPTDSRTPLFKIHGDVTPRGQTELVMGYSGHESFAKELLPLRQAIRRHRMSVVFYGASLRADANWAYILEALFSEAPIDAMTQATATDPPVEPQCHYLITADTPDEQHEAELWEKYRIRTLRGTPGDWTAAENCIHQLCIACAERKGMWHRKRKAEAGSSGSLSCTL